MDILGVILALIGLFSILSLLSAEHGMLTGWWVTAMRQAGGVGAFILPVGILLLGLWLILRKMERIPVSFGGAGDRDHLAVRQYSHHLAPYRRRGLGTGRGRVRRRIYRRVF